MSAPMISPVGIQPVDVRLPAPGGLLLAEIVDELLFDQLAEQLGDRRNAQIDSLAQIGDARIAFKYEMPDNVLFEYRILIAFGCEFEKRLFHDTIFCVNIIKIYQLQKPRTLKYFPKHPKKAHLRLHFQETKKPTAGNLANIIRTKSHKQLKIIIINPVLNNIFYYFCPHPLNH